MILYTRLVHQAIADMARVLSAFSHIDAARIVVFAAPRAGAARHGNLAQCCALHEAERDHLGYWYHPLSRQVVRVTPWSRRVNTRVVIHGIPMLYLILLRLPRLLLHSPLETVAHELLHIGPRFDGRIRRMRHGKRFDAVVAHLAAEWRRTGRPDLVEALDCPAAEIQQRWGAVVAATFASPFEPCRYVLLNDPPPVESHPDFRRLGLHIDPARVEIAPGRESIERVPAELTERDIVYRVFEGKRASRISAAALRAARNLFPAESL